MEELMVRIAAIQMAVGPLMMENYLHSIRMMERAAAGGAKMVCLPEGHLSQYIPQYPDKKMEEFAIPLDSEVIRGYQEKCRQLHVIGSISPSLILNGKVYSTDVLIDENGEILTVAKKNHIVQTAHFYEQDYYTPGDDDEPFKVVDTSIGRIGIIICYDRHYPESFRTMALKNADFVVIPAGNEKAEPVDVFEWEIRIGAFTNCLNCVMVNRVGIEGNMDFCGRSMFANTKGMAIAVADDSEQILYADLDLEHAAEQKKQCNYLKLRRPDVFMFR